jgi:hypothetical protein
MLPTSWKPSALASAHERPEPKRIGAFGKRCADRQRESRTLVTHKRPYDTGQRRVLHRPAAARFREVDHRVVLRRARLLAVSESTGSGIGRTRRTVNVAGDNAKPTIRERIANFLNRGGAAKTTDVQ